MWEAFSGLAAAHPSSATAPRSRKGRPDTVRPRGAAGGSPRSPGPGRGEGGRGTARRRRSPPGGGEEGGGCLRARGEGRRPPRPALGHLPPEPPRPHPPERPAPRRPRSPSGRRAPSARLPARGTAGAAVRRPPLGPARPPAVDYSSRRPPRGARLRGRGSGNKKTCPPPLIPSPALPSPGAALGSARKTVRGKAGPRGGRAHRRARWARQPPRGRGG